MTNLKPCPLCGGEAEHTESPDGDWAICCTVRGCKLTAWTLSEDIWQALPRPSESVLEVAREMRKHGKAWEVHGDGVRWRMEELASRLEAAAPGMGTPGEVWVHGPGCHGVTVYSQKQGDKPVGADGRWYRVDDLLIKDGTQPKVDAGECRDGIDTEHCGLVRVQAQRAMKAEQRAEKAERIVDEDSDRLVEAKRERDGLRERVRELEDIEAAVQRWAIAGTSREIDDLSDKLRNTLLSPTPPVTDCTAEEALLAERVRELEEDPTPRAERLKAATAILDDGPTQASGHDQKAIQGHRDALRLLIGWAEAHERGRAVRADLDAEKLAELDDEMETYDGE